MALEASRVADLESAIHNYPGGFEASECCVRPLCQGHEGTAPESIRAAKRGIASLAASA